MPAHLVCQTSSGPRSLTSSTERRIAVAALLAGLAACRDGAPPADLPHGEAVICLGSDGDPGALPARLDLSGTLIADEASGEDVGAPLPCAGMPSRQIRFADGDGVTWRLGVGLADAEGADLTPALDADPGDLVTLRLRQDGEALGFVLSGDRTVLAAADQGPGAGALQDGDVGSLQLDTGATVARSEGGCGALLSVALVFLADTEVSLAAGEDRLLTLDGVALNATVLASTRWDDDALCDEPTLARAWALWR